MLQDVLIDDLTGLPMADGTLTFFHDNSRTTLKNVFQQQGTPGAYTYVPLPNPMTLTSAGTMADANGNDIIPFYYPVSETDNASPDPYYVVAVNSGGQQQFTRANFPFIAPANTSPATGIPTNKNLIANSVFWRNPGPGVQTNLNSPGARFPITTSLGTSNYLYQILAPSQHDGYTLSDIIFIKNIAGATDIATFSVIPQIAGLDQIFTNDITPEYQLNMQCTATVPGETNKAIQIPISLHVKSLAGVSGTIVIEAQNVASSPNNTISISIFQFLGTGVPSVIPTPIKTLTLNSSWTKFIIPFTFPASTPNVSLAGDDALYLQIGFPLDALFNINIAKPSIYLSSTVPTNDTQTYDEVNAIASSPRTGDIRISINDFAPFGWVPCNDGTIGNPASNATSRAAQDTWPLFFLLWSLFKAIDTGSGGTNPICQMFNSSAIAVAYSSAAIIDFNANNQLSITKMLGRTLLGGAFLNNLTPTGSNTFTVSGNFIVAASNMTLFNGATIFFIGGSLPPQLSNNVQYYVSNFNGANVFTVSTTFANAINAVFIALTPGTGTVFSFLQGSFSGEHSHTLLSSELPDPITTTAAGFSAAGSGIVVIESSPSHDSATISNAGGNTPHNITQSFTFMNMYIKL